MTIKTKRLQRNAGPYFFSFTALLTTITKSRSLFPVQFRKKGNCHEYVLKRFSLKLYHSTTFCSKWRLSGWETSES